MRTAGSGLRSIMSIGVSLAAADETNYVDAIVTKAKQVAADGVKSVWFGQRFDYDAAALATVVGREVPELSVGTSAIPIFGRHPLLISNQAQTAQAATHGRFQLGLALGAKDLVEATFGLTYDRPVARLREFLTVLRELFTTGSADFHGETVTAAPVLPTALAGAQPPVPLLVAAMGPQALRVTGELADGTLPYLAGPKTLATEIVPAITAASAVRPRVIAFVAGVVTADVEKARANALEQMSFYERIPSYQRVIGLEGATRAAELAVIGDEETIAAAVQRYFDAGATEVVFTQTNLGSDEDERRTWKLLGELAG